MALHDSGKIFPDYAPLRAKQRGSGEIQLITGPMFCGKSTELIRRVRRYEIAKQRCFVMRQAKDTRSDDAFVHAHDGVTKISCSGKYKTLQEFIDSRFREGWDVVAIDEGQFFPDLYEKCCFMANAGCVVIVAALSATSEGSPFGQTMFLLLEAEYVTKLSAICTSCQADATFSALRDNVHKTDGEDVLIGGEDKYVALCRACRQMRFKQHAQREVEEEWREYPLAASPRVNLTLSSLPQVANFEFLSKERWRSDDDQEFSGSSGDTTERFDIMDVADEVQHNLLLYNASDDDQ